MGEQPDNAWQILGMRDLAGIPVLELLQRQAEVVEQLLIDEFDLAIGRVRRDQSGDAIDSEA
jgi:hypothetical protein